MNLPSREEIIVLANQIKVMKPNVIKKENAAHVTRLENLLDSPEYVAEEKIDGCHYLMLSHAFLSKDHIDKTDNFPHLVRGFMELGMPNLILDGEIFYPGKTSQYVTRVTGASAQKAQAFQQDTEPIHYCVFDILRAPNGTWCNNMPYTKRRKLLVYLYNNYIIKSSLKDYVCLTNLAEENKRAFKDKILADGGEGIVLKRKDSLYLFGKKPMWEWMKIKQADTCDLFITGYKEPTKFYTGGAYDTWPYWMEEESIKRPVTKPYYMGWVGALALSAYVNGQVKQICYASGLSETVLQQIKDHEKEYIGRVVQISFMEKTEDGYPRHPAFVAFHPDKTAEECIWEF